MRSWIVFLIALAPNLFPARSIAELVRYDYGGTVIAVTHNPYGISMTAASPLSGSFAFDSASAATHSFTSGTGYEQHIVDGFVANFSGVSLQASDYLVEVFNNVAQPGGNINDIFSVTFSSNLDPPLTGPLSVNGTNENVGLLNLDFAGNSGLFANTSLPTQLNIGEFSSTLSLFSDQPTGVVDVLFTITSLTLVPEPSSALLIIAFTIVLSCSRIPKLFKRARHRYGWDS